MDAVLKQAVALADKVRAVSDDVLAGHIGRRDIVWPTMLSLVSGRPAFFLGSPGIDKTGTVQAVAKRIVGAIFFDALMPTVVSVEQLIVESTSIEELPLPNGGKSISVSDKLGRAASAHLVFADEIWKSEARILQTLLDLAKGDGVRHEGKMVVTPLLAFLAASNELPDPEGNLGAVWSRMTLRVQVNPLDKGGKQKLVVARLARDRGQKQGATPQLTLAEVGILRTARPLVEVPADIVTAVLDIYQELRDTDSGAFDWLWADDRRFGRVFDVLQAQALLQGRTTVSKTDLTVLEWLLWDTPEQIASVRAKIAPYTRTALTEAQELVDALLAPGGTVATVLGGDKGKCVNAITQLESAEKTLAELEGKADDVGMKQAIADLRKQAGDAEQGVVQVFIGPARK